MTQVNEQDFQAARQMFNPFAIEVETVASLKMQLEIIESISNAFSAASTVLVKNKTEDEVESLNAAFPRFKQTVDAMNTVTDGAVRQRETINKRISALNAWNALTEEQRQEQRDILVKLDYYWRLIHNVGLRGATPELAKESQFAGTAIPKLFVELQATIKEEFEGLHARLIPGNYLTLRFKSYAPVYLDPTWKSDSLFSNAAGDALFAKHGTDSAKMSDAICGNG